MNVQDLYQSALYAFGQDPTNRRFNDDFYNALNFAQNDFCNRRRWGFLRATGTVTTTADTRSASLPTNFRVLMDAVGAVRITAPADDSGTELDVIEEDQFYQDYQDDDETGTPGYAWVTPDGMSFSPIPDEAYTVSVRYYKTPTTIANTSTTITVPSHYHEALQKMVWRRLQDSGYSSVTEIRITDEEIERLIGVCGRDDVGRYGGFKMNLPPRTSTIRTV